MFKKAETVSIFQSCPLSVIYPLSEISGTNLFLNYKVKGVGLPQDAPIVDFKKVYINVEKTSLTGYNELLRSLCPISL